MIGTIGRFWASLACAGSTCYDEFTFKTFKPLIIVTKVDLVIFNRTSVTGEGAEGEISEASGRGAMAGMKNRKQVKDSEREVIDAYFKIV